MRFAFKTLSWVTAGMIVVFAMNHPVYADDCSKEQRYQMPSCIGYRDGGDGYMHYDNQCGYTVIVKIDKSGCSDALHVVGLGRSTGDYGGCHVHRVRCCQVMMGGSGCGPWVPKR
jgi:hypothetical protein